MRYEIMTCDATRKRLAQPRGADDAVRAHLENCRECREFRRRLDAARGALRDHHAGARPDAAFSARVLERIHSAEVASPLDELGWAALRVLPATLVLTALVAWTAVQPHHGFASLLIPGVGDDALAAFIVSGLEDPGPDGAGVQP